MRNDVPCSVVTYTSGRVLCHVHERSDPITAWLLSHHCTTANHRTFNLLRGGRLVNASQLLSGQSRAFSPGKINPYHMTPRRERGSERCGEAAVLTTIDEHVVCLHLEVSFSARRVIAWMNVLWQSRRRK